MKQTHPLAVGEECRNVNRPGSIRHSEAAASSPPSKSADGAEEGAAGESRAGEARDGREAQEYLKEEVIVERVYGGGSGGLRK